MRTRSIRRRWLYFIALVLGVIMMGAWFQSSPQSPPELPPPTIRVTTHLVLVDAVVTAGHLLESGTIPLAWRTNHCHGARRSQYGFQRSGLRSAPDVALRSGAIQARPTYGRVHIDELFGNTAGLYLRSAGSLRSLTTIQTAATGVCQRGGSPDERGSRHSEYRDYRGCPGRQHSSSQRSS